MTIHFNWLPFIAANIWDSTLEVPWWARATLTVAYLILAWPSWS